MTPIATGAPSAERRPAIGVFGKIRAQGDFLRINAADPALPAFARWLEDGNELRHQAATPLAPEPFGFVFSAPDTGRALVGALGPGIDSVGRAYPLAVFAALSGRDLCNAFPLVPFLYREFLQAGSALLREAPDLPARQIAERLVGFTLPGASDSAAAEAIALEARAERAREFERRLLGDPAGGQQYYAFRTLQVACRPLRGRDPGRVNVAIDCPCERESDFAVWLELLHRLLQWPSPPSFFFRSGARPALVVSLGAPPPAVLPFFATAARGSQKIWPLTTEQPAAVSFARKSLPNAQILAIDGTATVGDLIASLSAG